jgi:hypothetical protein
LKGFSWQRYLQDSDPTRAARRICQDSRLRRVVRVPVLCLAIQETLSQVSTRATATRGRTTPPSASRSPVTGSWYVKDRVLFARRAAERARSKLSNGQRPGYRCLRQCHPALHVLSPPVGWTDRCLWLPLTLESLQYLNSLSSSALFVVLQSCYHQPTPST